MPFDGRPATQRMDKMRPQQAGGAASTSTGRPAVASGPGKRLFDSSSGGGSGGKALPDAKRRKGARRRHAASCRLPTWPRSSAPSRSPAARGL
jgi:hypothetical protein